MEAINNTLDHLSNTCTSIMSPRKNNQEEDNYDDNNDDIIQSRSEKNDYASIDHRSLGEGQEANERVQESDLAFVNIGLDKWERERSKWLSYNQNNGDSTNSQNNNKSKSSFFGSSLSISNKSNTSSSKSNNNNKRYHAKDIDTDEIIDLIFSNRWRTTTTPENDVNGKNSTSTSFTNNSKGKDSNAFPQPVPLPQMVDILVDLWEAEGLDG